MSDKALFLGTGGASGIPVVGCSCPICLSENPKSKRLRSSLFLEYQGKKILIDAGPDFRAQGLAFGIREIDYLLITHTHYDHVGGLDDLRALCFWTPGPIKGVCSEVTYEELKLRYAYFFTPRKENENFKVSFDFKVLKEERGIFELEGIPIGHMSYRQGNMDVKGYRFKDFAYVTDIKEYSNSIFEDLKGVKTLVISASSSQLSHVHFTVEQAVAFIDKVGAERGYLIHLSHHMKWEEEEKTLPSHIKFAYDGLEIELP